MRFKIALAALALGACAQNPPPLPQIQHVYCLTPDEFAKVIKAEPPKVGKTLTGDARKDFKIVAENDVLVRQYADGLIKILGGCTH